MKIKLENLRFNEKLTQLRPINAVFVSRYRQAYRSGKDLGTLIINKKTKEIVSGNHRGTAMLEEYGPKHVIEVEALSFASDQDILEKFVEENISHGNALTGSSRRAITLELIKKGAAPERVANLFGVAVKRIEEWADIVVLVIGGKGKKDESMPAKNGLPVGTTMTKENYETHWKKDRGIPAYSQAEQLTRWLDQGLIDVDCKKTMSALDDLHVALGAFLIKRKAA